MLRRGPEEEAKKKKSKKVRIERDVNRGKWASKAEFILSLIGYAVGIGNVWRFPYLCYRSGGGAFLIPYLIMLLICGIPLFYMEVLIGQFSSTGCIGMFRLVPLFKGVGIAIVIVNLICACYYSVIISYPIRMMTHIFTEEVPWIGCDHHWNTPNCTKITELETRIKTDSEQHLTTSSDEFFHLEILRLSSDISVLGNIVWEQFGCLLATWVVIYICVWAGIRSVGKVVYFTATFPYILLIILFIRGVTLPGAGTGIKFYLYPEWERLYDFKVWADAAIQIFFSLGPGWGGIVNMASFNHFRNNAKFDAILIPIVNCCTSIFSGFVVFSVLGFLSHMSGIPVATVATSGPGLAFVTYPEAIAMMPVPQLWAALFFFMLFLLGLDSVFVQLEAVVSTMLDECSALRNHKKKLTLLACIGFFGFSIIMTTNAGMYILQLLDWYSASIPIIMICIMEIIMVSYIYGINNFLTDCEFMLRKRPSIMWKILWAYITPVVLIFIFITSITFMRPITYNRNPYPVWAIIVGWISCAISLIWIPLYIFYIMIRKRANLKASLKRRLQPMDWTPADPDDKAAYETFRRDRKMPAFMSETSIEGDLSKADMVDENKR